MHYGKCRIQLTMSFWSGKLRLFNLSSWWQCSDTDSSTSIWSVSAARHCNNKQLVCRQTMMLTRHLIRITPARHEIQREAKRILKTTGTTTNNKQTWKQPQAVPWKQKTSGGRRDAAGDLQQSITDHLTLHEQTSLLKETGPQLWSHVIQA